MLINHHLIEPLSLLSFFVGSMSLGVWQGTTPGRLTCGLVLLGLLGLMLTTAAILDYAALRNGGFEFPPVLLGFSLFLLGGVAFACGSIRGSKKLEK